MKADRYASLNSNRGLKPTADTSEIKMLMLTTASNLITHQDNLCTIEPDRLNLMRPSGSKVNRYYLLIKGENNGGWIRAT
jgi:hypothetical protein